MTWNKRHKLLRRVFSTVMALVLAVSLLPTYAFAASVPTSTTTDGNAADFTGAWKSAHYKPGTYTVTANLAMPGQYNPILTGVTIRKVPSKTGIDLDNTTIEVIKPDLEPYGYTLDMNYAIAVKTNGEVCQNWLAGENVMTLTVKLGDYQKLGWSGDWLRADGNYGNPVVLFENVKSDDVDSYRVSEDGTTASVDIIPENYPSTNASKHMNEQVKVISIGNLGLLYIVTTDPTIQSMQNLVGRTVYSIGEGGPPEYTFEYMLEQYHLIGQVNFSFRSTPFEVLNLLQEEPNGVALLPQPFVEVAKPLVDNLNVPINITQAWNELNLSTGAESVTTVTVVRKAFREQHEQAVQEYLQLAKQSTDYTLANVEQAAAWTDTYETFMNPDIAVQAILYHHRGGDEAEALGLPADHV